jgi:hypothetical protein
VQTFGRADSRPKKTATALADVLDARGHPADAAALRDQYPTSSPSTAPSAAP